MYEKIVKPILFRFDAERIHDFATAVGEWLGRSAIGRRTIAGLYDWQGPDLSRTVDGLTYRTPFVLAAGFDYNGRLSLILPAFGLGGEEVGSLTARPAPGNLRPRLRRLPKSEGIIVNKGLRNDGVKTVVARLRSRPRPPGFVLGISLARTNDRLAASSDRGIEDYCFSLRHCLEQEVGDFFTLNISCPNAFGGEDFAIPRRLARLLTALGKINCRKPLYVKMPLNQDWRAFKELLQVILDHGLAGVVIGNLNKNYDDLAYRGEAPPDYCGGLSGRPCRRLSTNLIQQTRDAFGRRLTIIGCGGVMSPADAAEKFRAGADLIQLITGLIFRGPGLIRQLCRALAQTNNRDH